MNGVSRLLSQNVFLLVSPKCDLGVVYRHVTKKKYKKESRGNITALSLISHL